MASYYAQIDVNLTENNVTVVKTTTPKKPKNEKLKPKKVKDDSENINFLSSATKIYGTLMASIAFSNSSIGSYTGNKTSQSNVNTMLGMIGIGTSLIVNPAVGAAALASYSIKRATDIAIEQKNSELEKANSNVEMTKKALTDLLEIESEIKRERGRPLCLPLFLGLSRIF